MNIGIIGSEESRFTPKTQAAAIEAINRIIASEKTIPAIVSGRCPKGGVDVWAEDRADRLGLAKAIFPPEVHQWDGKGKVGFKQRNIKIAQASDRIFVIVPATSPGFSKPCFHCRDRRQFPPVDGAENYTAHHVQSGACWTAWYAVEQLGKKAIWIIV